MKRVCLAAILAFTAPAGFADTTGGHVPQVIEAPAPQIGPVVVQLSESVPVFVDRPIAGVSIGSSYIANVTVHDANTLLVTGRAYGSTSLHIIDNRGNVIVETPIHVVNGAPGQLVVNRGGADYSMSCMPNCQAAPNIGDQPDYFEALVEQSQSIAR